MSWGKGGGRLPFGEGSDSPSHENRLWGGGRESKGVQPFPPTIRTAHRALSASQPGQDPRRGDRGSQRTYKPAHAATSLPDGDRGRGGGGKGGAGALEGGHF